MGLEGNGGKLDSLHLDVTVVVRDSGIEEPSKEWGNPMIVSRVILWLFCIVGVKEGVHEHGLLC